MYKNYTKLGLVAAILLTASTALGATYLSGTVTANGEAYTNTNAYVYISCNNSYNWASDWAYLNSSGAYSFDSSSYYGPCGSYYSSVDFTSCEVYAYPAWSESDLTLAASNHYSVDIDCSAEATQDIALNIKDKTILVSVTAGENPVTSDITVSCSQQQSPWTYSYISTVSDDNTYHIPVIAGTYYCSAWCSTWGACDYGGYPSAYVTVGEDNETKSASLSFALKDKTIEVTVTAGSQTVTSDLTVYCSQQQSPWTYSSTSTATGDVYSLAVSTGSYYCSAYCSNWYSCTYSGYPSANVTVGSSDTTVFTSLAFTVKDKTLKVTLMAGSSTVTSGMTVYASEQGGGWSYSNVNYTTDGVYQLAVGATKYYVSAYCSDWNSCDVSGYPNATVNIDDDDSIVEMTLTFLENDATISGAVTDGTSGVSGAYVSIYSYNTSSSGTGSAWSIAKSVSGKATVTGGSADTTMVYKSATTDSSGAFQTTVPAGTYTIQVWPPWTGNSSTYGQATAQVTAEANTTTAVSITLPTKSAQISGTATDSSGSGISGVSISGWSYSGPTGTSDWFWTSTDSNGAFSVYTIEGLKYNVSAWYWSSDQNSTVCTYNNEGMQTIAASSTPQTVNFTYPTCDCTVTLNAADANGDIISSIYGGVNAIPSTLASGEYWYGIWGYLSGGTGTMKVQSDIEYTFSPYIWDSSYVQGDDVTGTCTDGASTINLSMLPLDATINGGFVDSDGNAISMDEYSYTYIYVTKGKAYRSCTATNSGFSCQVSVGSWCLGYWVDPASGYASTSAAASTNCVTMTSGETQTHDITLLQTGTISVTVLDLDGSGKASVWVEATPYSNQDQGMNDYQYMYMSNGCMTGSDGTCSINVGAASGEGTVYYVNAYIPYYLKSSENLINPQEVSVTVVASETVVADALSFEQPDGTSVIAVAEGSATASIVLGKSVIAKDVAGDDAAASSPIANATVDCFSTSSGGSFEVETDVNGSATCPCTTVDTWQAVAHNMVANNLWMSEATDITCLAEGGVGSITMNNVATVPEGKSTTITDAGSQSLTIELSDGFSVFFPNGSLGGTDEQVTCMVDITVTPFTANKRPASFYGYEVSCQDSNGAAIVQLNSNATFSVPVNQSQVENVGLTMDSIDMSYFDPSTGAYNPVDNGYTVDDTLDVITYQQNHLTSFVVVGNGNLAGIAGEEAGEEANEHGEEGGVEGAAAAASGGCGCNVNANPALAEKLLAPIALIGLFIALHVARLCVRRAKK